MRRWLFAGLCCTLALLTLASPIGAHGAGESHIVRILEVVCSEVDGALGRRVTYELSLDWPDGRIRTSHDFGEETMWNRFRQLFHYYEPKPICIKINSFFPTLDVPPILLQNRTLVPVRVIAESFGPEVEIEWDEVAWNVILKQTLGETEKSWLLRPDNPRVEVRVSNRDTSFLDLDAPPVIRNGRTLVPLRFIAESLGATVEWDGQRRLVSITTGGSQP